VVERPRKAAGAAALGRGTRPPARAARAPAGGRLSIEVRRLDLTVEEPFELERLAKALGAAIRRR
jgi:hypothetical protein